MQSLIDLNNLGYVRVAMICPACKTGIAEEWKWVYTQPSSEQYMELFVMTCPSCESHLVGYTISNVCLAREIHKKYKKDEEGIEFLWPPITAPILDEEIPKEWRKLYSEAYVIQKLSPRASTILGRLCLEVFLKKYAGVKAKYLNGMINEIIESGKINLEPIPPKIQDILKKIQKFGNKAAHVDEILDGELREVNPNIPKHILKLLPLLFDHLIVTPKNIDHELGKLCEIEKSKPEKD